MATLMELAVRLVGDIGEYKKAMSDAEQTAKKTANQIGKDLQQIGGSISGVGRNMTAAITLPIVTAGYAAVQAASDLDETKNKVKVVFGEMGDAVLAWSQDSAVAFGQSQNQALAAAGTFGNLFIGMGKGRAEATEMSTTFVQLASDLASFHNADPSDVLQAMQSGLIGQAEPMRKYGVLLTEAAVQAKAMEMGLVGIDGEMSEAAKLTARYAIIMEQTRMAQGDFARTSDGLANSQRIVKAQLTDAAAALGMQLLPYALKAVQFIGDLVKKFTSLSPEAQKVVVVVAAIAAAIGPVLMIVGSLISAIGAIIPVVTAVAGAITFPLIAIILAVVGVIALVAAAWKNNWGGIREVVGTVIETIRERISIWLRVIRMLWDTYGAAWWERVKLIWAAIMGVFQEAGARIGQVVQDVQNFMHNWWMHHGHAVQSVVQAMWNFIKDAFNVAATFVQKIIEVAVAIWQAIWERHGDAITKYINNVKEIISTIFKTLFEVVGELFEAFAAAFRGDWRGFGEHLRNATDAIGKAIAKVFSLMWENIKIIFGEWWRNIKDFFGKLDMKSIGKFIVDGLVNGLKGGIPNIIDAAKRLKDAFMEAIKGFFGIHSKSKLMQLEVGWELGMGTLAGWQDSMKQMIANVPATMRGLAPAMLAPASVAPGMASGMSSVRGGGGITIIMPVEMRSLINTADEYQAQNILAPMIIKEIREYTNR